MQKTHTSMMSVIVLFWIPLVIVTTGVFFTIYVSTQQGLRQGANDPQIQIAEDVARSLAANYQPNVIVGSSTIDISKSLHSFVIIFDESGKVIASNASLNGTTPIPPSGVFQSTLAHGEDRFTWQPENGVRIATVVTHFSGGSTDQSGFVLAGRSLREVEQREDTALKIAFLGWIASLVSSFLAIVFLKWLLEWLLIRADHGVDA